MPTFYQQYPIGSPVMTTELARMLHRCIYSNKIPMMKGYGYTTEYENHIDETWPIRKVPPSAHLFPSAGSLSGRTPGSDV